MTSETLVLLVTAIGVSTASAIDIATRRVPNVLTLTLALTGLVIAGAGAGVVTLQGALLGGLVGGLLMLPAYLVGATGGGDLKLLAAVSTLFGPLGALTAFLYTCIAGAALAMFVALSRRRLGATVEGVAVLVSSRGAAAATLEGTGAVNRFAYAPAIAIGALLVALGY